jgi:preprotein translocase subunit SecD
VPGVKDQVPALRAVDASRVVLRPLQAECAEPTATSEPAASEPTASEPADSEPPASTEPEAPAGPVGPNTFDTGESSPFTPAPPDPLDSSTTVRDLGGLECAVGPAQRGGMFGSATTRNDGGGWAVVATLSPAGQTAIQTLSEGGAAGIGVVVDDVLYGYGFPQPAATAADDPTLIIGGESMTERDADVLAAAIDRGDYPVELRAERIETVSETLGSDSLGTIVIAGLVGLAAVLGVLAVLYHRFVAVLVAGLALWGLLAYSAAALLAETTNYAITLAGAAGLAVGLGLAVDSHVVYFERLKDDVRHGRTVRNSAARSYKATWRTVLTADLVAIVAAIALFAIGTGSVRTFALYLGVGAVCDLVVSLLAARSIVGLLADNGWLDEGDSFGVKEYA